MSEQEEIQKRHQQIMELERFLSEAKTLLDMSGWVRENGIDIDRVMSSARHRCSAAEYEQAQREADEAFDELQRELLQTRIVDSPFGQSAQSMQSLRRSPRPMV